MLRTTLVNSHFTCPAENFSASDENIKIDLSPSTRLGHRTEIYINQEHVPRELEPP